MIHYLIYFFICFILINRIPSNLLNTKIYDINSRLNLIDVSQRCKFDVDKHTLITRDGYILTLFRINSKLVQNNGKFPIFLMHGIMADSNFWIVNGCKNSYAFRLASLGYDVWIGNARGTYYSSMHINKTIDDEKYWDFSFDEMAIFDLPDFLKYIIKITKKLKITSICHSQGCLSLLSAISIDPKINSIIDKYIAIAPSIYVKNFKGLFKSISQHIKSDEMYQFIFGKKDILSSIVKRSKLALYICKNMPVGICYLPISSIVGYNLEEIDKGIELNLLENVFSSTSSKNLLHLLQMSKSGQLRKFDYGESTNLIKYNSIFPPPYNISCLIAQTYVFSSNNDALIQQIDIQRFVNESSNIIYNKIYEKYNHIDYIIGKFASFEVLSDILELLDEIQLNNSRKSNL